jgi:DNA repair exonuclease SbcCD ATPase subunit
VSSYPGDQRWADAQHARRVEVTALEAELSRAKGEIDAAHVVLDAAGVHRSEGQSIGDRIASYIGPMESKLEERDAAYRLSEARVVALRQALTAAEARATAAEQERDREHDELLIERGLTTVLRGDLERLRAKLAAAERREAELQDAAKRAAAELRHAFATIYKGQMDTGLVSRAVKLLEKATTPQPSTPSPAPSAAGHYVCRDCGAVPAPELRYCKCGCSIVVWEARPSPSPRPERSEAGDKA